jgi:hypothetical protein
VAIILLSAHLYRKQMLEMDKRLFHKGVRIRAASDVENEVQPIDKTSLAQAEGIRENTWLRLSKEFGIANPTRMVSPPVLCHWQSIR